MVVSKKIYEIHNILYKNKLEGHLEPVEDVKIYKKTIISGSRDCTIRIWDLISGECKKILKGHTNTVSSVDVDDEIIASGSFDNTIRIWDKISGNCFKILEGHKGNVLDIKLYGDTLVSCSEDQTIKVWNWKQGICIETIECHDRKISKVAINKDKIISASWDHSVKVWEMNTCSCCHTYEGHGDAIDCLDSQGDLIVSGDQANTIFVWDFKRKKKIREFHGHKRTVLDLFLEGNILYSCSKDKSIRLWDINTGNCIKKLEGHSDAVLSIWKEDNFLISASADTTIRIWDDNSIHDIKTLKGHQDEVLGVSIANNKLISTGKESLLKIWDLESLEFIKEIDLGYSGWIWGLASEDNIAITSSDKGDYYVIDLNTGETLRKLEKHEGSTYRVALKNGTAVTTSWDNTAIIWDINTGDIIKILKGHTYAVYSAVIASKERILTAGSDATIRVWEKSGKCLKVLKGHNDEIFHIDYEDGIVVSASADKTIRAFNIKSGKTKRIFTGHKDQVLTVQIKNGIVFSGSLDKTIKIWDLEKGTCLKTLEGHSEGVKDLEIYKDKLISASYDNDILIWDIAEFINRGEIDKAGKLTIEQDTLVSQIQTGCTYDLLPDDMCNPDIIRIIYGLEPLDTEYSIKRKDVILVYLKQKLESWRLLGHSGHAPWLSKIFQLFNDGEFGQDNEENLKIALNEFLIGISESESLYWLGVLRSIGENLSNLISEEWYFDLEFSGQGPSPLEGFEWKELGPNINTLQIEDRTETALVFKLILKGVNKLFIPLIKSIVVQMKSDRGDIADVQFNNFIPDEEGNWSDIAMFKIDGGYRLEPIAIVDITDIRIEFESNLMPDFKGSEILEQISVLKKEQLKFRKEIKMLKEEVIDVINPNFSQKQSRIQKDRERDENQIFGAESLEKGYSLHDLENSPEAMNIFINFKRKFLKPRFGPLKIHVGGGGLSFMDKFLEFLEPKIIFFSTGGTIASFVLLILTYAKIFNIDLLGTSFTILDDVVPLAEILIYGLIYGFLALFLIFGIFAWIKYQRQKKKQVL
ncbi:MAG: WD40 repeat domain-containing protein [Promethearchaeia archaeon]